MTEIVKICKVHGPLKIEQVAISPRKARPNGSGEIRCLACKSIRAQKCHKKRRDKFLATATPEDIQRKKDKWNEYVRKDRIENPEKYRAWERNYRAKNLDISRKKEIAKRYNLTLEQYDEMLKDQGYLCAICRQPETTKSKVTDERAMLSVDHCHKTGKIRQFLCRRCNNGIGNFFENEELFIEAILYLRKHKHDNETSS